MAHWRDTYRPARFFFLDVRAGVVVLCTLVWIRPWTVAVAVMSVALAFYLERIGMSVPSAMRALRSHLAGRIRPALGYHKIRKPIDFGRRRMAWEPPAPEGEHFIDPVTEPADGRLNQKGTRR